MSAPFSTSSHVFSFFIQVKGGAAEADGHLMHGDQILAVNGDDLRNSTQEYVAIILKVLYISVNNLSTHAEGKKKKKWNNRNEYIWVPWYI